MYQAHYVGEENRRWLLERYHSRYVDFDRLANKNNANALYLLQTTAWGSFASWLSNVLDKAAMSTDIGFLQVWHLGIVDWAYAQEQYLSTHYAAYDAWETALGELVKAQPRHGEWRAALAEAWYAAQPLIELETLFVDE
jgi:hypothetical protein